MSKSPVYDWTAGKTRKDPSYRPPAARDMNPQEDEGEDQAKPKPSSSTTAVDPDVAAPTPFIYPIRSLLSTVQPASAQPPSHIVDPYVFSDLAESLKREVAAKRAAASSYSHSAGQSSASVLSARPSGNPPAETGRSQGETSKSSSSGNRAAFPTTFAFPADDFVPLPTDNSIFQRQTGERPDIAIITPSSSNMSGPTASTTAPGLKAENFAPGPEAEASGDALLVDRAPDDGTSQHSSSWSSLVRLPPAPIEGTGDPDDPTRPPGSSSQGPSSQHPTSFTAPSSSDLVQGPPVTTRLKYIQDENGHHHVVGREGVLTRCEDEPIRTPGAIQSYGVIVVLEEDLEEGRLLVRQVSENAHHVLGLSVPYLFSLECFTDIFPYDQAELLWKHITFLDDPNADDDPEVEPLPSQSASQNAAPSASDLNRPKPRKEIDGPDVFLMTGWSEPESEDQPNELRSRWRCWCAAHRPVVPKRPVSKYGSQSGYEPPTSHSAMKVDSDGDIASNVGSEVARSNTASEQQVIEDYQRLIILEFELEHDEENPIYSRHHFADTLGTSGSRTSHSGSASGGVHQGNSSGSGQPSSGTYSGSTTTPMPGTTTAATTSTEVLSTTTPLTNAALQALADGANPEAYFPNPNEVFVAEDSNPSVVSAPNYTDSVNQEDPQGLEGNNAWYPSIDDIHDSTTSRSRPIKALEKMRLMARGIGTSRQSPALRRVAAANSTLGRHSAGDPSDSSGSGSPSIGTSSRSSFRARGGPSSMAASANSVGTMDVFAVLAEVIEQLGTAADLESFLKIVVGVIKDLTQFHRVLIYQFDDAWNGQVVAELLDWTASHDLFKGLHFPASDIPPQARQLYVINKVRSLYDREQPTSRLVCRDWSDLDPPLDMTHCYLRAMSPIHLKYLGNMGVRASMSVSITAFGQLWGLIACHSYGNAGMRVSFPVRQMLRLLSDSISRNIERLSYAQRLHTRKLISTMPTDHHPTGYIVSNAEDLLGLFDADYGVLVIGDGAKILGPNDHGRELLIVAQYLRMKQYTLLQVSQSILKDFPDLVVPSGMEVLSGLLYVPLSAGGRDFIVFLRRGQVKDVIWAGKPHKPGAEASATLEPRRSFKAWAQTVTGRCRTWTDEQVETAGVLALVYGKFIEVWRQKESAVKSTQLANLLLTNASHEVRTPLNQIIGFLELALEGNLDEETRSNLIQTHKASKSLLFTINDLLDLTKLESGHLTQFNDPFDLPALVREAVAPYEKDAQRKGVEFEVITTDCPQFVIGDSRKIASVVSNLTANAVKFTNTGRVSVECKPFQEPEGLRDRETTSTTTEVAVEIIVSDTGCGIPGHKLEDIFRQFEQVERAEEHGNKPSGLGLGLAVVARIVEQVGGQLRVDSNSSGSRFSFLLPFTLPDPNVASSFDPTALVPSRPGSHTSAASEVEDFVSAMSTSHIPPEAVQRGSPSASLQTHEEGVFHVQDSKNPIRALKVDEFALDRPHRDIAGLGAGPAAYPSTIRPPPNVDSDKAEKSSVHRLGEPATSRPLGQLRVMVVEDDKINSALMVKRLKKYNHIPVAVQNGQEAADLVERDFDFDCIMMDLQMPILNGYQATSVIRRFEAQTNPPLVLQSHQSNGRIPIFAVSASISEDQRSDLWELGLDGWILKPVNWDRVQDLIAGITNLEQRRKDLYTPDHWEKGGWLGWYEGNGPL